MISSVPNPASVPVSQTRYLARQPILDARENVFGYELLFRGGPENLFCAINSDRASLSTMDYSLALGSPALTHGKRSFINCTRDILVGGLVTLLPPDSTVLEILEDVPPDDEVIAACRRLRALGYSLALDDFTAECLGSPFLDLVTFVKVDLRLNEPSKLGAIAHKLSSRGLRLIAEKVETREELQLSRAAGYHFFQGYFFCKPTIVTSRDISHSHHNHLRLLQTAVDPEMNFKALERIIRSDVALCYRLLRYLNSAAFGLYPVRSIMHALTLIGEREIRKWIALVTATSLAANKTPELVRVALIRARFCESMAPAPRGDDYFLAGLFSLLNVMLDRPMSDLVGELPVAAECRVALLGGDTPLASLLRQCGLLESADPETLQENTDSELIFERYQNACVWADTLIGDIL